MKLKAIPLALLCAGIMSQPVLADDMSELRAQLKAMQLQIQLMQAKLDAQDSAIKKQQQTTTEIKHQQAFREKDKDARPVAHQVADSLSIGGVIEILAHHTDSDNWSGDNASDIVLDTFELGIDAQAGEWVTGHILFLYEQDPGPGRDTDDLQVDEAFITIANSDVTPFYAAAGRMYLPFGNFESNMISDPATLTLAEIRNEVVQLGFETESGFYGSGYVFNGDIPESKSNMSSRSNSHIDNYGLNIGYAMENDDFSLDVGAGYVNNIAAAAGLFDAIKGNAACAGEDCVKDYVGGMSLYAIANIGSFNLIGEYIAAADDFSTTDFAYAPATAEKLRPKAWNIEGAYHFNIAGKESTFALGYQKTEDFYLQQSKEYFEKAWLASISVGILESTTLAAEWRHADGYSEVKNAIGNDFDDEDRLQVKLSYEF